MIYELMNQKLRRNDANHSHIVLDADGSTFAKFFLEHGHRNRIENAVAPYLLWRKQLVHILARRRLEKTASFRCPIGLLMPHY